jgi:phosphatidylethanolamine-binding protein (PEBP) family uncharacterized protein
MPGPSTRASSYSVKFAGKEAANNLRPRGNTFVAPNVKYTSQQNDMYTVVIWDPDAPNPSFLHWLVINIPEDRVQDGETIIDYMPPTPPSGTHRYYVGLYRQPKPLNTAMSLSRTAFSIDAFVKMYSLQESGVKMVRVQDES